MTRRRIRDRDASAHAWAEYTRQASPGVFGMSHCGDPSDVYDSPFRRWAGLPPVHLCRLRQLAREQSGGQDGEAAQ